MVSTQYILDIITIHTKNSKEMRSFISSRLVAKAEPDPIFFFFWTFCWDVPLFQGQKHLELNNVINFNERQIFFFHNQNDFLPILFSLLSVLFLAFSQISLIWKDTHIHSEILNRESYVH